jgi:surfeit locus 1 family protein
MSKWRWRIATAAMVGFVIACAFLARWQYHRAHERAARIAAVTAAEHSPPSRITPRNLAGLSRWSHVYAEGHYDDKQQAFLKEMSKPRGSEVGYEVLTPLRLSSGALLLVNRGWVPVNEAGRVQANLAAPAGRVHAIGFLAPLPRPGLHLGGNPKHVTQWPVRLLFPNWAELERLYGPKLLHRMLYLAPDMAGGYSRHWKMTPSHGPAQNYNYMTQWIVFALIALGLWLWFGFRRLRGRRTRA